MTQTNRLKTQADAIVYFIQKLDAEMVNDILDDNLTYQEFSKHIFIQKLGHALDEFIRCGDEFLKIFKGSCNEETCNIGLTGFSFIGNRSKNYMDLLIEINEGRVLDICECNCFINEDEGIEKRKRIQIDKKSFTFSDPF